MKISIKKIIDLFNDEIVDDIIMIDNYSYDNEVKLKYIDDDKEFIIKIEEKDLKKLVDVEDNNDD